MAKADPDLESRATGLRMYQDYTWFWKDEPVPLRDMPEVPRKVNVVNVYEPALRKLFRNDYFRRGWVIQEVAMSRDAEVYWGDGHMWYMFFSLASKLLITLEASILVYDNVAWTGANNFDSMQQMHTIARGYPLIRRLQMSRKNDFTDPLDRVYGMLAMFSKHDYSYDDMEYEDNVHIKPVYGIPVLQCYKEVARHYLSNSKFWDLFISVQHSIDSGQQPHTWPSWVPDWRICANRNEIRQLLKIEGDWVTDVTVPTTLRLDSECILPHGLRLAEVRGTVGQKVWQASDRVLRELLLFLGESQTTSKLVMAATAGHSSRGKFAVTPPYEFTWRGFHSDGEDQNLHLMNAVAFLWNWTVEEAAEYWRSQFPHWPSEVFDEISPSDFAAKVRQSLTGRCLFETEAGWLGAGNEIVWPGDQVVIFRGCPYPFALHPLTDGRWRLIGECYVDAEVVEESIKVKLDSGEETEEFCIC